MTKIKSEYFYPDMLPCDRYLTDDKGIFINSYKEISIKRNDKYVDKRYEQKIFIYFYLKFRLQQGKTITTSLSEIMRDCFCNRNKYTNKTIKKATIELLKEQKINDHNLIIEYSCDIPVEEIKLNTKIQIHKICEPTDKNNSVKKVPIEHSEFLTVINILKIDNHREESVLYTRYERSFVIYSIVKYRFYQANHLDDKFNLDGNSYHLDCCIGINYSLGDIEIDTCFRKEALIKYILPLESQKMITKFYPGNYSPTGERVDLSAIDDYKNIIFLSAPTMFCLGYSLESLKAISRNMMRFKRQREIKYFTNEHRIYEKIEMLERSNTPN